MGYEVDYIAVGEGEKSGDAICLRYGNLAGPREEQVVITIDGGTIESGDKVVEHVKAHYCTDSVDVAILSHPDTDHASGMRQILENLRVGMVAMHLPWDHSHAAKALLEDSSISTDSIRTKLRRNLSAAREIEQIAKRKQIPIVEPFAGATNNSGLVVLGPTKDYYREMLCCFDCMPTTTNYAASNTLAQILRQFGQSASKWISENWFTETLKEPEPDATSPENNSSVIFMLQIDGQKLLFTGDAGVPALHSAIDYANSVRISVGGINFFDVPHHGSRRNLGPSIVNRLFGSIRTNDTKDWTAFISAAKAGEPKHPNKRVTNALRRRGASVSVTAGRSICFPFQAPPRAGWVSIEPIPFYTQVEDDE
ncbi:MAG TPA: hypothetical protein VHD85_12475 [Terracidiphilus sp.]|nr:hypothetical protein [Terracidiphilus sp.]